MTKDAAWRETGIINFYRTAYRMTQERVREIWDTWITLALVLILLLTEWTPQKDLGSVVMKNRRTFMLFLVHAGLWIFCPSARSGRPSHHDVGGTAYPTRGSSSNSRKLLAFSKLGPDQYENPVCIEGLLRMQPSQSLTLQQARSCVTWFPEFLAPMLPNH